MVYTLGQICMQWRFLNGFPTQHDHFDGICKILDIAGVFGPHQIRLYLKNKWKFEKIVKKFQDWKRYYSELSPESTLVRTCVKHMLVDNF